MYLQLNSRFYDPKRSRYASLCGTEKEGHISMVTDNNTKNRESCLVAQRVNTCADRLKSYDHCDIRNFSKLLKKIL